MEITSSPSSQPLPAFPRSTPLPSVIAWQGSDDKLRERILAAARADPDAFYASQRPRQEDLPPPKAPVFRPRPSSSSLASSSAGKRPRHNSSSTSHRSTPTHIGSTSSLSFSHSNSSSSNSSSFYSPTTSFDHANKRLRTAATAGGPAASASAAASAGEPFSDKGNVNGAEPDEDRWDLARLLEEVDARMLKQTKPAGPARGTRRTSTEPSRAGATRVRESIPPASPGMTTRSSVGKGKERERNLYPPNAAVRQQGRADGSSSSSRTGGRATAAAEEPIDDYLHLGMDANDPDPPVAMQGIEDGTSLGHSLSSLRMKDPSISPQRATTSANLAAASSSRRPFERTVSSASRTSTSSSTSNTTSISARTTTARTNPVAASKRSLSPLPPPPASPRKPPTRTQTHPPAVVVAAPSQPTRLSTNVTRSTGALSPLKNLINHSQTSHSSQTSRTSGSQPPRSQRTRSAGPVTVGLARSNSASNCKDPRRTFRPPFKVQPPTPSPAAVAEEDESEERREERERDERVRPAPSSDGPRVDSDTSFDSFDAILMEGGEDLEALLRVVDGV